jgi:hypothetical protein
MCDPRALALDAAKAEAENDQTSFRRCMSDLEIYPKDLRDELLDDARREVSFLSMSPKRISNTEVSLPAAEAAAPM